MTQPLEIATRLVEMVGDRAEAEAQVGSGVEALTRFANSFIHQNVAEDTPAVGLKLAVDGKVASGTTNRTDDESLSRLVEETLEAASLQPVDPEWPGLTPPSDVPDVDHWDQATADADPDARAAVVEQFVAAGPGMRAAGYCDTAAMRVAFANSAGHAVEGRTTRATVDGIHQTDESAGSAHQTGGSIGMLDGAAAGSLAAERAKMGMNAYDIKPGDYEVVLSPECAATILTFLAFYGFNGKAVIEGQSFVDLGKQQFDETVEVWDDATGDGSIGLPFDLEGTPKGRVDLIAGGVSKSVVHDRRTAKAAGVESTGHSIPGSATYGAFPSDMVMGDGDESPDDMIAAVDRGLYVATFNYCRILDPKSQVVTGLTRNGTFMIENGKITGAVTNMRFTQSFVEALGPGRVLGLGNDRRFGDGEFGAGLVRAPSLRLASWHFTGGAEG